MSKTNRAQKPIIDNDLELEQKRVRKNKRRRQKQAHNLLYTCEIQKLFNGQTKVTLDKHTEI